MAAQSEPAPPTPLHLAMIGTRGVPAAYGGFETAVEEIGSRLAGRGHDVTVYCRHAEDSAAHEYAGMHLVHLPALPLKTAETLSHTALSVAHLAMHLHHPDAAFVFNSANAPFVPILHARGVPVAVHVDGLEWQRDKWHGAGRAYYRWAEQSAVRNADALIADAKGIADYYASEFGASTRQIAYGAPVQLRPVFDRLEELGLTWKGYHLVVARFEPENHVDLIVAGYELSAHVAPSWWSAPLRTPRSTPRGFDRRPTTILACDCSAPCTTRISSTSCTPARSATRTATPSAGPTRRCSARWGPGPPCWHGMCRSIARSPASGAGTSATPGRWPP